MERTRLKYTGSIKRGEGDSSVAGVLLDRSQTTLIQCPISKTGSYTVPESVTQVQSSAFSCCSNLTSVTMGSNCIQIGEYAFTECTGLKSITLGSGLSQIPPGGFAHCTSLTNIAIPSNVSSIGEGAFAACTALGSVTIGNSVTNVEDSAFSYCTSLTRVTLSSSLLNLGDYAFYYCKTLTGIYFQANAPNLGGPSVFFGDDHATAYYLPSTTGWGPRFGGLPTAVWVKEPELISQPQTQTAEAGSALGLWVQASSPLPLSYQWYFNATNLLSCNTNCALQLTNLEMAHAGPYVVIISNELGSVTSAPAILNVISAVERRAVPVLTVTGEAARLLTVEYANSINPAPNWTPLVSLNLTSTPTSYFDLTLPPFQQRFYRASQNVNSSGRPSLALGSVPAITLRGAIGQSVRLDYINRFGPIDAWVKLDTVVLTNTSQLYFDMSSPGQPQRLYRLVQ